MQHVGKPATDFQKGLEKYVNCSSNDAELSITHPLYGQAVVPPVGYYCNPVEPPWAVNHPRPRAINTLDSVRPNSETVFVAVGPEGINSTIARSGDLSRTGKPGGPLYLLEIAIKLRQYDDDVEWNP